MGSIQQLNTTHKTGGMDFEVGVVAGHEDSSLMADMTVHNIEAHETSKIKMPLVLYPYLPLHSHLTLNNLHDI